MTPVLLAGAVAGLGVLLLVLSFDRSHTRGAAGLAQLDADRRRFSREINLTVDRRQEGESVRLRRTGAAISEQLQRRGIRLPVTLRADLGIVGRSVEAHLAYTLLGAVVGFFVPLLASAALFAVAQRYSAVPLWLGLIGVAIGLALPSLQVLSTAAERRRDFRHVVGSFLDLVAMNLAGGRGIPEALQSASSISDTWGMVRIRDTLDTARLAGITPWSALGTLGQELKVDELRDLAAALALVAEDGAKVRDSLTARAQSMRQRELAEVESRAEQRSQSMLVAQLLLCVGFLIFLVYPAVAQIAGT